MSADEKEKSKTGSPEGTPPGASTDNAAELATSPHKDEDGKNWRYLVCDRVRHYLYTRCRYPAFTPDYIARHVDLPETEPGELQAFVDNGTAKEPHKALVIVVVYLTYCLKNLFVPLKLVTMFDFDQLEANVRLVGGGGGPASSGSASFASSTTSSASTWDHDEIVRQVTCLATNCTHLSPVSWAAVAAGNHGELGPFESGLHTMGPSGGQVSRLASDMSKLPLFKLCHPRLNSWYSPATALDSLGVLVLLCVSFNAFLLGSWITLQQLVFPAANEMIMFIVAPGVTARMAWRRTRELLASVGASYGHFCLNSKLRFFTQTEHEYHAYSARLAALESTWSPDGGVAGGLAGGTYVEPQPQLTPLWAMRHALRGGPSLESGGLPVQPEQAPGLSEASKTQTSKTTGDQPNTSRPRSGRSEAELARMASECLPIIRSRWWRRTVAGVFLSALAATVSEILVASVFAFRYIRKRLAKKVAQLDLFAGEMRRQSCNLWYATTATQTAAPHERRLIDLAGYDLTWTTFSRIEGGLFNVMPALGVSMMFAYYWAVVSEIEIWLAELRMLLVATLVVARTKLSQVRPAQATSSSGMCAPPAALIDVRQPPLQSHRARPFTNATSSSSGASCCNSTASLISSRVPHSCRPGGGGGSGSSGKVHTSSFKASHFYNMKYLREQFQRETAFFGMTYFSLVRGCRFDPHDGQIVHSQKPRPLDINDRNNFKMREVRFMGLIGGGGSGEDDHGEQRERGGSSSSDPPMDFEGPQAKANELLDEDEAEERELTSVLGTMEQVYVNFRLFIEHVRGLAPSMGVVLAITYLLNYGLACIAVACSRKFGDLKSEMMFIITFGWFVSNILILLAANFHANAKKLQPVMWSIIAQLTLSQDTRIKHMRFLWLKQVQILDNHGGLALQAFGLRVTYVNMIQIIIWTVTIVVMALKS